MSSINTIKILDNDKEINVIELAYVSNYNYDEILLEEIYWTLRHNYPSLFTEENLPYDLCYDGRIVTTKLDLDPNTLIEITSFCEGFIKGWATKAAIS